MDMNEQEKIAAVNALEDILAEQLTEQQLAMHAHDKKRKIAASEAVWKTAAQIKEIKNETFGRA